MARVEQAGLPAEPRTALADDLADLWGSREDLPVRVVSARVSTAHRLKEIWRARELLVFLVRSELKVRYKNSFLGFLWSFLNPAMVLLIYYVVFRYIEHTQLSDFAVFLFCGLLPWNLFNTAILSSAGTLVANAGIVKKVAFPREILALSQVGVALSYFFFQTCILVVFLVGFQVMPEWRYLPEVLLALVCDIVFSAALALVLSALNVYMRDIEHLIQVVMVALFFAEPIVYPYSSVQSHLANHGLTWLYLANPLTAMVLAFQRCIYGNVKSTATTPSYTVRKGLLITHIVHTPIQSLANYGTGFYLELMGGMLAGSLLLFYVAMLIFRRVEGNFAEEL